MATHTCTTCDDAAPRRRAVAQIRDRLVDARLRHRNAGVSGCPQCLNLRDRHGAFVEVAALGRAHVTPAAFIGLLKGKNFGKQLVKLS